MKKVILLFEGRTGSSLFGGLLNQHANICFLGEELAQYKEQGWVKQEEWITSVFDPNSSFSDPRRDSKKGNLELIGFKIKLRDIADPPKFKAYIEDNDIDIIYMTRENLIKQVLSSIRAMDLEKEHGVFNLDTNSKHKKLGSYKIPIKRFNTILLWINDFEQKLAQFIASLRDVNIYRLTYETVISDMDEAVNSVCRLYGLSEQNEVRPDLVKVTDDKMENVIENYDAIKSFYANSIYRSFFD